MWDFQLFYKTAFSKIQGVESRLYKDLQWVEGGCQKFSQKLPKHLKFQFDFYFAGLRAPNGPQVADEKKIEKRRFWNDLAESRDIPDI